jgi:hypothetical protein
VSDNDFSSHPKSIAEIKASKAGDGALWTPRDALISALREIDSGNIDPSDLIVVMRLKQPDSGVVRSFTSAADGLIARGMLAAALQLTSK